MSNLDIKIDPEIFNDVYLPYLTDYSKRLEVYYGGGGSGKSKFVFQKIVYKYLSSPKPRKCLVVRKTQNSLKDSCFEEIKTILSDWKIYDQCKINKTDLTIELLNGSKFLFKGMDDRERIKSIQGISDIICEEVTEIEEMDYDQLNIRLRSKLPDNQMFCMFNPISKSSWVYKRWFENEYNHETTRVLHTTYKDNKFLPQANINSLLEMERTNPVYFRIYCLGEFASLDKLVYTRWNEKDFDYKKILKEKPHRRTLFALDWGFTNDPTAIVSCVIDEIDKKIWVYDEHYQKQMTNEDIFHVLQEKHLTGERIVCDSAEPKSIEELRRFGCKRVRGCVKGKGSIMSGISIIQQYEIIVHPSCKEFQEELLNYSFKKDRSTGEYINVPIDEWNHLMDAFRYAVSSYILNNVGRVTTFDRRLLF